MSLVITFLSGIIVPIIISLFFILVGWKPWEKNEISNGIWSNPLALGLGFVATFYTLFKLPKFPPNDITQWLFYIAIIGAIFGIIQNKLNFPKIFNHIAKVIFIGGITYANLKPIIENEWETKQTFLWLLGIVISLSLFWFLLEKLEFKIEKGSTMPMVLMISISGNAIALLASGSAKIGQLTGSIAAIFGVCLLISWFNRNFVISKGMISVTTMLLSSIWINSHFYVSTPIIIILLLVSSPLLAWLGQIEKIKSLKTWQYTLINIIMVSLPIIISLGLILSGEEPEDDYYY